MRGLLEDDSHWQSCLEEAAASCVPSRLRSLFAIILTPCELADPEHLWLQHRDSMCEDILFQCQQEVNSELPYSETIFNEGLLRLEDLLQSMGGQQLSFYGLPKPTRTGGTTIAREILRETSYNAEELAQFVAANEPRLTADQRAAYAKMVSTVDCNEGAILFIDAPGGTGKTFLLNLFLAEMRARGHIVLATASSGIAATLLQGGRTAHSTFKIPINLVPLEKQVCGIKRGSATATLLKDCKAIVWDEATMAHKLALEAVERTLQDIRGSSTLFGGIPLIFCGDFQQTLPVVRGGTRANEVDACIKASKLWKHVQLLHLHTNMRVHLHQGTTAGAFADLLLSIGEGRIPVSSGADCIQIPQGGGNVVNTMEDLKAAVFCNLRTNYSNSQWLCERAILAPKNDCVAHVNRELLQDFPGNEFVYNSIDSVPDPNGAVMYPTEFLNSLEPAGMPPHLLILKVGVPIMVLRNIDPTRLCNGTRCIVKKLMANCIEVTIVTGPHKGTDVFLPRIPLMPSDANLPFEFKRLQFPVRVCFAMSINKAQGQSLHIAGLYLQTPCFSHGQYYVGCSRVGSPRHLTIYAPGGETRNVVYHEAL